MKTVKVTGILVASAFLLFLSGCLSSRERMQLQRKPQNNVFQVAEDMENADLVKDKRAAMALWNNTKTQSVFILQIRPDAKLTERYHRSHELTLQCLTGSAIIELQGERHFVTAPATIVIPRLWSYSITPHKSDEKFTAMAVFSPVFKGNDVVVTSE